MSAKKASQIWLVLVALFAFSVAASYFFSPALAIVMIFFVAFAKAFLVAGYYMQLLKSPKFLTFLMLSALLCALLLFAGLFPDIVLPGYRI